MKSKFIVLLWTTVFAMAIFAGAALAGTATVSSVEGDVTVQLKADGAWTKAAPKMSVPEGATLKTGTDGKASLTWSAGNVVKIYPLTQLKASAISGGGGKSSLLSLERGRVMSKVEKLNTGEKFEVKTPTAIAGVRGTGFDTEINPTSSAVTISVVEGTVAMSVGEVEVMVEAGFESSAMPGETPVAPAEIPPAKLEELKQDLVQLKTEVAPTEEKKEEKAEAKPEAKPEAEKTEAAPASDVVQSVTENTVHDVTINNAIIQQATEAAGCPAGGGCINGTISFGSGSN